MRKVLMTGEFKKKFKKLDDSVKNIFDNKIKSVANSGKVVGKVIRYDYIREIKYLKYRIYFYVFEYELTLLLLDVSVKKNQREIIQKNIINLSETLRDLHNIYKLKESVKVYMKSRKEELLSEIVQELYNLRYKYEKEIDKRFRD